MCWDVCHTRAVHGSGLKACSSLNHIAHIYRFDKFRVFEQRLICHSPVEANKQGMLRAGTIRDSVLWRDEERRSIGNWVIPESNPDEIIKYVCCE